MCECYWKAVCFQNLSERLESLRLSLKCLMLPTKNLFRPTACTLYRVLPYFCGPLPWESAVAWVFMWQSSKIAFSSSHPSLLTRAPLSSSAPFVLYVFGVSICLCVNVFAFIDPYAWYSGSQSHPLFCELAKLLQEELLELNSGLSPPPHWLCLQAAALTPEKSCDSWAALCWAVTRQCL